MPIDDEDEGKKIDEEGSERRGEREIWVSFSFDNVTRNGESVQTPPSTDSDHSFVQWNAYKYHYNFFNPHYHSSILLLV